MGETASFSDPPKLGDNLVNLRSVTGDIVSGGPDIQNLDLDCSPDERVLEPEYFGKICEILEFGPVEVYPGRSGFPLPSVAEFRDRHLQGTESFLEQVNGEGLLLNQCLCFAVIHVISGVKKNRSDKGREPIRWKLTFTSDMSTHQK